MEFFYVCVEQAHQYITHYIEFPHFLCFMDDIVRDKKRRE